MLLACGSPSPGKMVSWWTPAYADLVLGPGITETLQSDRTCSETADVNTTFSRARTRAPKPKVLQSMAEWVS